MMYCWSPSATATTSKTTHVWKWSPSALRIATKDNLYWETRYAHLGSRKLIRRGQPVRKGVPVEIRAPPLKDIMLEAVGDVRPSVVEFGGYGSFRIRISAPGHPGIGTCRRLLFVPLHALPA